MALAVISGLITSTVLTLVVIPTLYDLLDRAGERLLGRSLVSPVEPAAVAEGGLLPDAETAAP
jgi:HAE1 family hydrophobic/amphiphilic exporter-1